MQDLLRPIKTSNNVTLNDLFSEFSIILIHSVHKKKDTDIRHPEIAGLFNMDSPTNYDALLRMRSKDLYAYLKEIQKETEEIAECKALQYFCLIIDELVLRIAISGDPRDFTTVNFEFLNRIITEKILNKILHRLDIMSQVIRVLATKTEHFLDCLEHDLDRIDEHIVSHPEPILDDDFVGVMEETEEQFETAIDQADKAKTLLKPIHEYLSGKTPGMGLRNIAFSLLSKLKGFYDDQPKSFFDELGVKYSVIEDRSIRSLANPDKLISLLRLSKFFVGYDKTRSDKFDVLYVRRFSYYKKIQRVLVGEPMKVDLSKLKVIHLKKCKSHKPGF